MRLDGRKAVVTGGSRGIGWAVSKALAEAGASVFVAARDEARAARAARQLHAEFGAEAASHPVDVADADSVTACARAVEDRFGPVDILVNNAGVAHSAPITRLDPADWNRVLAVNATGTFLCTRAFLPAMLERGWGRVVNVASTAGVDGARYIAAYAASKHAVVGFTRCVAMEVEGRGVTVNAVCPGFVDTDLTQASIARIVEQTGRSEEEARDLLERENASGRLLDPEEVAGVIIGLCAEEAAAINGQAILVDGEDS
ncbi:MAG: 3-hydroxyacyl-CoA dehydrogenase [Gemmatimonadota bacterium]|nr:MAG: 3-hydroxyacyl-CoA dehydrogenase [Gemmatimonadota bacterium]